MRKVQVFFIAAACLCAAFAVADNDPTRPLHYNSSAATANSGLRLSSILISDNRRIAVINGQLVSEGDTVAGATLIRILDNRVHVTINGKNRELKLHTTTVKRAVKRAGK